MIKYFAKLGLNNKVTLVTVIDESILKDAEENEHESLGVAFLEELTGWSFWTQTWKNGSQRKHFAGKGFTYNEDLDAFILPKPYTSWSLNETTCLWEAPIALPDDGKKYIWNEATTSWVEIE